MNIIEMNYLSLYCCRFTFAIVLLCLHCSTISLSRSLCTFHSTTYAHSHVVPIPRSLPSTVLHAHLAPFSPFPFLPSCSWSKKTARNNFCVGIILQGTLGLPVPLLHGACLLPLIAIYRTGHSWVDPGNWYDHTSHPCQRSISRCHAHWARLWPK